MQRDHRRHDSDQDQEHESANRRKAQEDGRRGNREQESAKTGRGNLIDPNTFVEFRVQCVSHSDAD